MTASAMLLCCCSAAYSIGRWDGRGTKTLPRDMAREVLTYGSDEQKLHASFGLWLRVRDDIDLLRNLERRGGELGARASHLLAKIEERAR